MNIDCCSSTSTVISCVDIDSPFASFCWHKPKPSAIDKSKQKRKLSQGNKWLISAEWYFSTYTEWSNEGECETPISIVSYAVIAPSLKLCLRMSIQKRIIWFAMRQLRILKILSVDEYSAAPDERETVHSKHSTRRWVRLTQNCTDSRL